MFPLMGTCYQGAMQIVPTHLLVRYGHDHPAAEGPLRAWHSLVSLSAWQAPADIAHACGAIVRFLPDARVSFDLPDGDMRIIARVSYAHQLVRVEHIGPAGMSSPLEASNNDHPTNPHGRGLSERAG